MVQVVFFVRTKHGAERLTTQLVRMGVNAGALHGGHPQTRRNRALAAFRDGAVPVLVATDVAARGIHVDDVSLVLHVDPPQDGKDYLHRSGRTARAGESGVVVLLATPAEERAVRRLLADAGVRPQQKDVAPGDSHVASVTGARRPHGSPVTVARLPQHARPTRPARPNQPTTPRRPHRSRRRRASTR